MSTANLLPGFVAAFIYLFLRFQISKLTKKLNFRWKLSWFQEVQKAE